VSRRIGDGTYTLFWYDRWLGDVLFCRRFSRLFDLAVDKSCTVATMFCLGWEEGVRRGVGEEGCGFGRGSWWQSVDFYLTILFCGLMYLTGGYGTSTFMGLYGTWSISTSYFSGCPYC